MTSPVDTSVKFFSSTMADAPVLTRAPGSLLAVLDACLRDGWGTKQATALTVAGGVATLAFAGTSVATPDAVVIVSGSSIAALNGEQRVVTTGAGTATFRTTAPDGQSAAGVSFKLAPLGWEKPFTGANKGAYRSPAVGSTGMFLMLDDTSDQYTRVKAFEGMTAIDAGTRPFPLDANLNPFGALWHKGTNYVASDRAVPWLIVGDGRIFYYWHAPSVPYASSFTSGYVRCFGDGVSLSPTGDAFGCLLNYSNTQASYAGMDGAVGAYPYQQNNAMPRALSGVGGPVAPMLKPLVGRIDTVSGIDTAMGDFPSRVDGSLYLSPQQFVTNAPSGLDPRMVLPGIHWVAQSGAGIYFQTLDRIAGSGTVAGRTLLAAVVGANNTDQQPTVSSAGVLFFDVTGPWR